LDQEKAKAVSLDFHFMVRIVLPNCVSITDLSKESPNFPAKLVRVANLVRTRYERSMSAPHHTGLTSSALLKAKLLGLLLLTGP
jgi:hypothetical protein